MSRGGVGLGCAAWVGSSSSRVVWLGPACLVPSSPGFAGCWKWPLSAPSARVCHTSTERLCRERRDGDDGNEHHEKKQAPKRTTAAATLAIVSLVYLLFCLSFRYLSLFLCLRTGHRQTHSQKPAAADPTVSTVSLTSALDAAAAPALHRHGLGNGAVLRVRQARNHDPRNHRQEGHALHRAEQPGGARR